MQRITIARGVERHQWWFTMPTVQANEAFARHWNEAVFESRDLDAIDDLVAEEFVLHDEGLPEPVYGPDGARDVVEMVLSAFPDMTVELEAVVAEGDLIAVRNTFTGTHEGEYLGIAPTGVEVEISVVAFQRIEDGQLVEEWQLVDRLGLLRQLGVVDPPTG